jgi:hypothetical protein
MELAYGDITFWISPLTIAALSLTVVAYCLMRVSLTILLRPRRSY